MAVAAFTLAFVVHPILKWDALRAPGGPKKGLSEIPYLNNKT